MALVDFAYNNSPLVLQNLMISAYGRYLRHLRYGGVHRQHLELLLQSERFSRTELAAYQQDQLQSLLEHAGAHVPFYRTWFRKHALRPREVDLATLSRALPVVTKSELRESRGSFLSSAAGQTVDINTSGTSGAPLTIAATRPAIQRNYAFFARFLRWSGVAIGESSATFAGRLFVPRGQRKPPYWRKNLATNSLLLSSYHISDRTLPDYVRALEEWNPAFIDAYPSAIYAIAHFILESALAHSVRPRVIVTSSETLSDSQRRTIESAFGCPVRDQYGSAEMVAFFGQCEHGSYHINPEYGIVELLKDDGEPAAPGEPGELVCTGFLNHAMPLIRYRIGDSAVLSNGRCACGRELPIVQHIVGRTDDLIVTRDGRQVGRLDPVFKGLGGIKETQIVQVDEGHVVVRLVKGAGYTGAETDKLRAALARRIGEDVDIRFEYVAEIEKTRAGKFRSVISNVRPQRRPAQEKNSCLS